MYKKCTDYYTEMEKFFESADDKDSAIVKFDPELA